LTDWATLIFVVVVMSLLITEIVTNLVGR